MVRKPLITEKVLSMFGLFVAGFLFLRASFSELRQQVAAVR